VLLQANDNIANRLSQRLNTFEGILKSIQDTLNGVVKFDPREKVG
jgi:hypothetical protein